MPHMIFAGPLESGKTSTSLITAKPFLSIDLLSTNHLEVNAYLQLTDINIDNLFPLELKEY